jgi:hypothetical protein
MLQFWLNSDNNNMHRKRPTVRFEVFYLKLNSLNIYVNEKCWQQIVEKGEMRFIPDTGFRKT